MSVVKPQSLSLVDTISAGYQALNRRPWALLIPVGVSTYLWLSNPLTLTKGGRIATGINQALDLLTTNPQARQGVAEQILHRDLRTSLAWLNLVPVLDPLTPGRNAIHIGGPYAVFSTLALINLLALLWSCLFLALLSSAVRYEPLAPVPLLRRTFQVASTIIVATLIIVGISIIVGLPLFAISALIVIFVPASALPIALAWYIACFWAYVYISFTPEAILISRAGPFRALGHSIRVVRHNMIGTVGLLIISFLILNGLRLIWAQVAVNPLGIAAAILGSAYVGSGLSAARLEFYRDQVTRFHA
ncbi:hypothetical protein [Candidatus Oscillochloris fontis]|uniref:DUF7847 domain-containing protein n=1 Tax=Candidatus Oscillochloris fontis TaxID=2496868 RepID=UPI00101D9A80|nr:hypothetical protein [Candidatus Oscillochloris fontis]